MSLGLLLAACVGWRTCAAAEMMNHTCYVTTLGDEPREMKNLRWSVQLFAHHLFTCSHMVIWSHLSPTIMSSHQESLKMILSNLMNLDLQQTRKWLDQDETRTVTVTLLLELCTDEGLWMDYVGGWLVCVGGELVTPRWSNSNWECCCSIWVIDNMIHNNGVSSVCVWSSPYITQALSQHHSYVTGNDNLCCP